MPASRQRFLSSFMACAVVAMIGMCLPVTFSFSRIAAVTSNPLNSGICTSIRTKSNDSFSRVARASRPLLATTTVWPRFVSRRTASTWFTALSSASRMWSRCRPSRNE